MESKTLTLKDGRTLEIVYDEDAQHPFEDDDCLHVTVATWHPRYRIGTKRVALPSDRGEYLDIIYHILCDSLIDKTLRKEMHSQYQAFEMGEKDASDMEMLFDKLAVISPVYAYEHSGITVSTAPFSCTFDSGQVGVAVYTKEQLLIDRQQKRFTKACARYATSCIQDIIETIDDFLQGNCYGFRITDADGEELESCWGFYGDDHERSGLFAMALTATDHRYLVKTGQIKSRRIACKKQ